MRPTLEYTYIDPFTMSGTPATATLTMSGPSGTKPLVTLLFSYTGGSAGLTFPTFSGSGGCSNIGRFNLSSNYVDMWYRYNVPIVSGSTTLTFQGGGIGAYGGVEVAYWDALAVTAELASAGGVGSSSGGNNTGGFSADESLYGMMMGSTVSTWHLAGTPLMEAIYPSYATSPPGFTNSAAVAVGGPTQAGAPMVCSGFIREPSPSGPNFFGFSFGTSTTWDQYVLKITGNPTLATVAGQWVTILG